MQIGIIIGTRTKTGALGDFVYPTVFSHFTIQQSFHPLQFFHESFNISSTFSPFSMPAKKPAATDIHETPPKKSNLWFAVAMLLVGFIAGSVVTADGTGLPGWLKLPELPLNAAPTVPTPPLPPQVPTPPAAPSAPAAAPDTAAQDAMIPPVDPERDHIKGNLNADVAVIEYSDLECPFCKRIHPTLEQLIADDTSVQWVYRHFPLGPHKNAEKAAEATECAGKIGGPQKFWEMIDVIFLKGPDNLKLGDRAEEIGVSASKMEDCLTARTFLDRVKEDMAGAASAGVNGTPSNFIIHIPSGRIQRVMGAQPLSAFRTAIEAVRSGNMPTPTAAAPTAAKAPTAALLPIAPSSKARPTLYTVPIRVEDWSFTPSTIRVKKGDTVTLRFVGTTGSHGVSIPGLNIDVAVEENQKVEVPLPTDKTGTFPFSCNVACGSGHSDMKGMIVVE